MIRFEILLGIILLYLIYHRYLRNRYKKIKLNFSENKDFEYAKKELDKLIRITLSKKLRYALYIDKSSMYGELGEFAEANRLLKKINSKHLSLPLKVYYFNNLCFNLLQLGEIEEAGKIIEANKEVITYQVNNSLSLAVKNTLAVNDFFQGNLQESRRQLEEIEQEEKLSFSTSAWNNYYLALLELEEGKQEAAVARLEKFASRLEESYIKHKIRKTLYQIKLQG